MRPTWHSRSTSTHMHQDAIDEASCTMGLSLGEYSALVFANAMSFEDGLKLVKARAEAMDAAAKAASSSMASMERTPSGVASTTVVVTVYFTVHVTGSAGCSRAHATVGSAGVGAAAIGAAIAAHEGI